MAEAQIRNFVIHDIIHFGLRIVVGTIFVAHSLGKFEPGFAGFVERQGLPPEMQIPIALAEFVPGVLLIIGGLSRISAGLLCIVMLGAIFVVKGATNLTGQGGIEFELLLLIASLVIAIVGPGRISIAHIFKKVPRVLQ